MKKNNKGFSLVELIIVIAIMAVLMAVLAPQFLRYVERSRLQSDNTALGEIANACKVAATDERVANAVADGATITVTIPLSASNALTVAATGGDATLNTAAETALGNELTATIGNTALTSNTYVGAATAPTIQLVLNGATVRVQATNYMPEVNGTSEATHVF